MARPRQALFQELRSPSRHPDTGTLMWMRDVLLEYRGSRTKRTVERIRCKCMKALRRPSRVELRVPKASREYIAWYIADVLERFLWTDRIVGEPRDAWDKAERLLILAGFFSGHKDSEQWEADGTLLFEEAASNYDETDLRWALAKLVSAHFTAIAVWIHRELISTQVLMSH